jgi:poly(A) polymerase
VVSGDDLIAAGMKPGPVFKELLERVREAQLDGVIHSKDEGLALVGRILAEKTP